MCNTEQAIAVLVDLCEFEHSLPCTQNLAAVLNAVRVRADPGRSAGDVRGIVESCAALGALLRHIPGLLIAENLCAAGAVKHTVVILSQFYDSVFHIKILLLFALAHFS